MDPSLVGVPCGVIQYNPYGNLADLPVEANRRMDHSNGSLIAVSYEVRVVCMSVCSCGWPSHPHGLNQAPSTNTSHTLPLPTPTYPPTNTKARARGVTRIMRGDQARAVCPEIALIQVAVKHKKADLTPYRHAGQYFGLGRDRRGGLSEGTPQKLTSLHHDTIHTHRRTRQAPA